MAQYWRSAHFLPQVTLPRAVGDPPIALGANDNLRPLPCRTGQRRQKPLVDIAFPVRYVHHQRAWTPLLDLTGQLIALQPPVTLLLFNGLAVAFLRHGLLRPLPHLQP